jgi:hypothetical protein
MTDADAGPKRVAVLLVGSRGPGVAVRGAGEVTTGRVA